MGALLYRYRAEKLEFICRKLLPGADGGVAVGASFEVSTAVTYSERSLCEHFESFLYF